MQTSKKCVVNVYHHRDILHYIQTLNLIRIVMKIVIYVCTQEAKQFFLWASVSLKECCSYSKHAKRKKILSPWCTRYFLLHKGMISSFILKARLITRQLARCKMMRTVSTRMRRRAQAIWTIMSPNSPWLIIVQSSTSHVSGYLQN